MTLTKIGVFLHRLVKTHLTNRNKVDVDTTVIENNNIELAKVKSDVSDIKSMMNEIMQIVAEKETVTKELESEDVTPRFKEAEKLILLSYTI